MGSLHEDLSRDTETPAGTVRGFAIVWTVVLSLAAAYLWRQGVGNWWWPLVAGILMLALGLIDAAVLQPLNRGWHKLGILLGRIVSPLVMGLIFFGVVTPTGLIRRLFGHNSLALKFDSEATSYWISRKPAGPSPDELPRQF